MVSDNACAQDVDVFGDGQTFRDQHIRLTVSGGGTTTPTGGGDDGRRAGRAGRGRDAVHINARRRLFCRSQERDTSMTTEDAAGPRRYVLDMGKIGEAVRRVCVENTRYVRPSARRGRPRATDRVGVGAPALCGIVLRARDNIN